MVAGCPAQVRYVTAEEATLRVVNEHCCGLDIHKKTISACAIVPGAAESSPELRDHDR